jgi:hypothetical protein
MSAWNVFPVIPSHITSRPYGRIQVPSAIRGGQLALPGEGSAVDPPAFKCPDLPPIISSIAMVIRLGIAWGLMTRSGDIPLP